MRGGEGHIMEAEKQCQNEEEKREQVVTIRMGVVKRLWGDKHSTK